MPRERPARKRIRCALRHSRVWELLLAGVRPDQRGVASVGGGDIRAGAMRAAAPFLCVCVASVLWGCASGPDEVPGPKAPPPSPAPSEPAPQPTTKAAATTPLPPERPPLAEMQRTALSRLLEAFRAHDAKKVAALYSDTVVSGSIGPLGWEEEIGQAPIEKGHTALFAAFPDMVWQSPRAFLKGDVAIQEWVSNATHKGDLGSMTATHKPTGIHGISVYWFDEDGLIRRDHTYYDSATIARQTGSLPGKAREIPPLPAGEMKVITSTGAADEGKRVDAARAMYAAFAGEDEKAFLATLDPEVVQKVYSQPEDQKGHKAAGDGYRAVHKAFSDLKVTATNAWGFGSWVVAEVVMTGKHTGPLGPIKATKKAVTVHSLDVLTFGPNDKVATIESYSGSVELLGQVGALADEKSAPAKAPGPPAKPKK